MKILSLFDGLAGAMLACNSAGVIVNEYYTSEIDLYCSAVVRKNFNIIELGNIETILDSILNKLEIDLLIGGSPCQDLTQAKANREGLCGKSSKLFFEYLRIKNKINPKYFLLENVGSMSEDNRNIISNYMGINPVEFNSNLLVPQNRKRYYWTNIERPIISKVNIKLSDILESDVGSKYDLSLVHYNAILKSYKWKNNPLNSYCGTLMASYYKKPPYGPYIASESSLSGYRMFTPLECERLQGIPENYTKLGLFIKNGKEIIKEISDTQRYKMIGNSFTVPIIACFLRNMR